MPITTLADLKINPEHYFSGYFESVSENIEIFNSASSGAITLTAEAIAGYTQRAGFFRALGSVKSRDPNADPNNVLPDTKAAMFEETKVKVYFGLEPVTFTRTALVEMKDMSPEDFSFEVGRSFGEAVVKSYCDHAIGAIAAAVSSNAGMVVDESSSQLTTQHLYDPVALYGDMSSRVRALLMHSSVYHKLVRDQSASQQTGVGGVVIYGGTPATFGLPVVVSDNQQLVAGTGVYRVLALTDGAVSVKETDPAEAVAEFFGTGYENQFTRVQAEGSMMVGVKGYAWGDSAPNTPTLAQLSASTNWAKVAASDKNTAAGMLLIAA